MNIRFDMSWRGRERMVRSIAMFIILVCCFFVCTSAFAAPSQQTFKAFDSWAEQYIAAPADEQSALEARGIILAKSRRDALAGLIRTDPKEALKYAVPISTRELLPDSITVLLEERVSGKGIIALVGGVRGSTGQIQRAPSYKVIVNGKTYIAHLYGRRAGAKSRRNMTLHGIALDGHLALHESPIRRLDKREAKNAPKGKLAVIVNGKKRFLDDEESFRKLEDELDAEPPEVQGGLGALRPTEEEEEKSKGRKLKKIGLNRIGLERIKESYRKKGRSLPKRFKGEAPTVGQELQLEPLAGAGSEPMPISGLDDTGQPGTVAPPGVGSESAAIEDLPYGVDNSLLKYWRSIFNQSGNSCTSAGLIGYQSTHMVGILRDWDVSVSNARRFAPLWGYNMVNGGANSGSSQYTTCNMLRDHGLCADADWSGVSGVGLRKWAHADADIWRRALGYKITYGTFSVSGSSYESGILRIKQLLANGYVLTFACDVNGFRFISVSDDPNTANDEGVLGQQICHYAVENSSGHVMTIVGYNDDIWCDVNQNGFVDDGEKGALKYANSWGTGYKDGGYAWISYDALKGTSEVSGWTPPADRKAAFWGTIYWLVPRIDYTPRMVAVMQVRHKSRSDMTLSVGIGDPGDTTPDVTDSFTGLSRDGGAYGFDGNLDADLEGNFVLDMEGLNPALDVNKRYFLNMQDSSSSSETGIVEAFWLEDSAGNVLATATNTPLVADNSTVRAWVDFTLTDIQASTVSIAAAVADVYEGTNAPGVFVVSRTGDLSTNLYVALDVSGTATEAQDYLPFSHICLIPAGESSNTIEVLAMDDTVTESDETVIVTLQPGLAYSIGGNNSATVTIHEQQSDLPTPPVPVVNGVSITCEYSAAEPASNGLFKLTRYLDTNTPVTVHLLVLGTAESGTDYTALPTNVVFAANEIEKLLPLNVIDDGAAEDVETVSMYILTNANYEIDNWSAEALIVDDDNSSPIVTNAVVYGTEDILLAWDISTNTAYDPDTTNLTYTALSMPTNGTLGGGMPNLTYLPDQNWNGTDSFLLKVSDGWLDTQVIYQIVIDPVNDPPVCTLDIPDANNDVFLSGSNIPLQALITDIDTLDPITNMEFLVDGAPVTNDLYDGDNTYTGSVSLTLDSYNVMARAYLDGGGSIDSASQTIRVVDPVAAPWTAADIGTPGCPGTTGMDGTTFVSAGGGTISSTADKFQFCSTPINGNGEMIARITSFENSDNDAEAGVMFRSSLDADARFVFSRLRRYRYRARLEYRTSDGGSTAQGAESGNLTAPRWLKLVKSNDTFTAYHSADGSSWIETGSISNTMPSTFYVGLAVAATVNAQLCTVEFDNVTVDFVPDGGDISVLGVNGAEISDGDAIPSTADGTDFGNAFIDQTLDQVFVITNSGTLNLSLTGLPVVAINGDADFTVFSQPSTPIAPGDSANFTVRFVPAAMGVKTAEVSIASDDLDENPYTFAIQGAGVDAPVVSSSAATDIGGHTATLNGTLDDGVAADVYVYWGTNDGGANPSQWGNTGLLSSVSEGGFTYPVSGLDVTTTYYYNFCATNAAGSDWAVSDSFTTLFEAMSFKVQRGSFTMPVGALTVTLTNGADYTLEAGSNSSNSFIRIVNTRLMGGGHDSGGGDQPIARWSCSITNPANIADSVTFARNNASSFANRIAWELIEYTGQSGGDNEIIVRDQRQISVGAGLLAATGTSVNVSSDSAVAVFITGQRSASDTQGDAQYALYTAEWLSGSDEPAFTRGAGTGAGNISYAVIEFAGSNWADVERVEQTMSSVGSALTQPVSMGVVSNAFLHVQRRSLTDGLDEMGAEVWISA
ncbi:Calx-beta domain-containing protein, partial [Verrucomicrobiota bacterium]